jgi:PAS domain S-box-containing protein
LDTSTRGFVKKPPGDRALDADLLAELLAGIPIALYVWQLDDPQNPRALRLVFATAASVQATGLAIEPNIGATIGTLFPATSDERLEIFRDVALGAPARSLEDARYDERPFSSFAFPLTGRRVATLFSDVTAERASGVRAQAILDSMPDAFFVLDADWRCTFVNDEGVRLGQRSRDELIGRSIWEVYPNAVGTPLETNLRRAVAERVSLEFETHDLGSDSWFWGRVKPTPNGLILFFQDMTGRRRLQAERDRLAAAVEQAAESVEMTDARGRIIYVNPAFERSTGYSRDEVVGENPRLLKSGVQAPAIYEAMWAAISNGTPWIGDLVNRRKDGSLITEEAVISPIRDAAGAVHTYVAVKRDVTRERALESQAAELVRERAVIADTIRSLQASGSPEDMALAMCRQIVGLRGLVAATIFSFELDGRAMALSFVLSGQPDPPLRRLPLARSHYLAQRATEGPWIEPWVSRPGHPYNELLVGLGSHLSAFAPVRNEGRVIGILVVDGSPSVGEAAMADALPAVVEFASLASALIGRQVADRTERGGGHARIAGIIKRRAFRSVFQPILNLQKHVIVGYEALTRFDDAVAPDVHFAEADRVGLGLELETVTLESAIDAGRALPANAFLNLNSSPSLILQGEALAQVLRGSTRGIVLEVTEHAVIEDYPAFHAAVRALGPRIRLAVDDAGSGYASLRHVVELRPAFVKVDRSLVVGLDADPSRQAMIAGLKHFAVASGCRLIAEGIETAAELAALRTLGIRFGQGFFIGPPAAAEAMVDNRP